jgi:hypothetical protein
VSKIFSKRKPYFFMSNKRVFAGKIFWSAAAVFMWLQLSGVSRAQDTTPPSTPFISVTGSLTVTSDLYSSSSNPDSAQPGRRPTALHRLLFSPTITFGDLISLPFNIILTTPETNTNTGSVSTPSLAQFFENPANSLGFSSFSPRIGWAQFNLGSYTPAFSQLSVGDQQIFGGGFDLTPGKIEVAASVGVAQRSIEPDSARSQHGIYRRDLYATRVGYGPKDSSHFAINFVYMRDSKESLKNNIQSITPAHPLADDSSVTLPPDTIRVRAEEGFIASTDFGIQIGEGVLFKAEGATSIYTRDQSSDPKDISGNPFGSLYQTRVSSRLDFAANAGFIVQRKIWGITLSGLYMGAGFTPIGYPFMQADRLELSVAPSIRLFDSKLNLRASVGQRMNNLSQTKAETTRQLIASGSMSADISEAFNLSANYSNFGISNDQTSDTLKVKNTSQAFSVDPSLTFAGLGMMNSITASAGLDDYQDFNTITGAENSNKTRTYLLGYNTTLDSIPLSLGTTGTYMENQLPLGTLIIRSVGVTASYSLFDRKLVPSASVTASGSTDGTGLTDQQIFYKVGVRWNVTKAISLSAMGGNNRYTYANPAAHGSAFAEQTLQLALSTRF